LHNLPKTKPLFLAIHLTISHWPFYWFNDQQAATATVLTRYQHGISAADHELKLVLSLLKNDHLLDNALVVLLSDHGTSLGLTNDRIISAKNYMGNTNNIKKLTLTQYANTPEFSLDFKHDFGVDTTYGYGGDVLSFTQTHAMLSFKGYGFKLADAKQIRDPVSLMDITPTILSLIHAPIVKHTDGESLATVLLEEKNKRPHQRDLFFETTFSLPEIEKETINVSKVVAKTASLYELNPATGLISILASEEKLMNSQKQHGLLRGDWFLAHYPKKTNITYDKKLKELSFITSPAYFVLVNVKTGQWTTEINNQFAKQAPMHSMQQALDNMYGQEMLN
jgi:hypothetical protein